MFEVVLSVAIASLILLATEWDAKKKQKSSEVARKIPHMVGGAAIATWPFFVNMQTIFIIGIVFLIATFIVRRYNLFAMARTVDRLSWGEPMFALGIIVTAAVNPSPWIFAAAILHLAFADGIAALVGTNVKNPHVYHVMGNKKTIEGTLSFMAVSALITFWIIVFAPAGLSNMWPIIFILPIISGLTEAIAPFGLDNLLVPLVVVVILNSLRSIS